MTRKSTRNSRPAESRGLNRLAGKATDEMRQHGLDIADVLKNWKIRVFDKILVSGKK